MHDPQRPARSTPAFAQAVERTIAAYDACAADYAARHEEQHPWVREWMEAFIARLEENDARHPIPELGRPGDDITLAEYLAFVPVLDAGCGPGQDARALARAGYAVLGVDLSQGMLDQAGERTARRLPRGALRYALMDLRRLDLPDASCRGVWCAATLPHLPRHVAPRAVAELVRVTRAGGPVAITFKRRAGTTAEELIPYAAGGTSGERRFFAYYDEEEAERLLAGAGLEVIERETAPDGRPGRPDWLALLTRKR